MISDTHLPRGSRRLPEACVERLRAADLILHAGDFTTASVLADLRALGPPVRAVHGNADEPALRSLLPARLVIDLEGCRIGLAHDAGRRAGRHARLAAAFPGCTAVVYGHSHLPEVERAGDMWMLNPGSPTERRRAPTRSMLDLVVDAGTVVAKLVHVDA